MVPPRRPIGGSVIAVGIGQKGHAAQAHGHVDDGSPPRLWSRAMQAADPARVAWTTVSGHRAGRIEFKRLLHGTPGRPDNFELSLVRTFADYATPRHRHNFDQIRCCLSGAMNYAPRKDLVAGSVAYFPEGNVLRAATDGRRVARASPPDRGRERAGFHALRGPPGGACRARGAWHVRGRDLPRS